MQATGSTNQFTVMYIRTYVHTHIIHTYMWQYYIKFPFNEKTRRECIIKSDAQWVLTLLKNDQEV